MKTKATQLAKKNNIKIILRKNKIILMLKNNRKFMKIKYGKACEYILHYL
jgi:hypothetical protein